MRTRDRTALLLAATCLPLLSACKKDVVPPKEAPRPVTVVELKTIATLLTLIVVPCLYAIFVETFKVKPVKPDAAEPDVASA